MIAISMMPKERLRRLSLFGAAFEHPRSGGMDDLMEGLYLRTEADGGVTGRTKLVRTEFVDSIKLSEHWQHQPVKQNLLAEGADLWE